MNEDKDKIIEQQNQAIEVLKNRLEFVSAENTELEDENHKLKQEVNRLTLLKGD